LDEHRHRNRAVKPPTAARLAEHKRAQEPPRAHEEDEQQDGDLSDSSTREVPLRKGRGGPRPTNPKLLGFWEGDYRIPIKLAKLELRRFLVCDLFPDKERLVPICLKMFTRMVRQYERESLRPQGLSFDWGNVLTPAVLCHILTRMLEPYLQHKFEIGELVCFRVLLPGIP
jgi:hypothetical protein